MIDLAAEGTWPQDRLDRDYTARASVSAEVFDATMATYRSLSDVARESAASFLDVCYDAESGQALDIFGAGDGPRPLFVFLHGGYWRALSRRDSAFMAPALSEHGIMTAAVDYRLAPEATLAEIVREVRAAVAFLWRNAADYRIDRSRIFVGGSSAGAHLTGMVLADGWHKNFGAPPDIVRGALPVSGLFHLAPIAASHVQAWMRLTPEDVSALSPAEHIPARGCPIVLAWAGGEPAGFARQSIAYADRWRTAGHPVELLTIEDRHHFDVILDLASPRTRLTRALTGLIGASG